ncbi:MAG: hypothetical protein ACREHD_13910, partial [Pirellulales bacterium]
RGWLGQSRGGSVLGLVYVRCRGDAPVRLDRGIAWPQAFVLLWSLRGQALPQPPLGQLHLACRFAYCHFLT